MDILIIVLLTFLNGVFSLSEIALISVKRHNIEKKAENGNKNARTVLRLLENPEHLLSSIQLGITLIGVIAGAYGAAQFIDDIEPFFQNILFFSSYSFEISFFLIVGGITYFTIVAGELIPKSIALHNPDKVALIFAPFIYFFSLMTYPLVKILSFSTKIVVTLLGLKENNKNRLSTEELLQILKSASRQGIIRKEESFMHENVLFFSQQKAKVLKTHRSEVEWINIQDDFEKIKEQIKVSPYSKFPVCQNSLDDIIGIISVKDFFEYVHQEKDFQSILKKPLFIPETMSAIDILRLFKENKEYLGVVIDEFGSFEGVISLRDLTEAIVGDLPDAEIDNDTDFYLREDNSLLINGSTEIQEVNEYLKTSLLPTSENYLTLAGFIIDFLGFIPQTGEKFVYQGYEFEIIDMDDQRVDKVLLKKI